MQLKVILLILLGTLMDISSYCQSATMPVQSTPSPMVSSNSTKPPYPMTKIIGDDTVVIMTLQQGKDMNKQFIVLKENIKSLTKSLDTSNSFNTFLLQYNKEVAQLNKNLEQKVVDLTELNNTLVRKVEFDQLKTELLKNTLEVKLDLYKAEMGNKTELLTFQLESEKRNGTHRARQSAILGGLVVGGVAITGAMIISWMPSTWFK